MHGIDEPERAPPSSGRPGFRNHARVSRKRSHTIAAVAAATGELLGEKTVQVGARGFASLLVWARGLEGERIWALEDCRHVAGSFERFLIARGERVLRVPTKLMAGARRGGRERGKSDSIDSVAVARAALREGLDELPVAQLDGPEFDIRLLVDQGERLVRQRVGLNNTMRWHLHDLWPELQLPGSALFYGTWGPRVARRLARAEQTMRVRIARDELRRIRELSQTIKAPEHDRNGSLGGVFDHVEIAVSDLAASERFYRTVLTLGIEPSHADSSWSIGTSSRSCRRTASTRSPTRCTSPSGPRRASSCTPSGRPASTPATATTARPVRGPSTARTTTAASCATPDGNSAEAIHSERANPVQPGRIDHLWIRVADLDGAVHS
jgi:hypothetical protein